MTHLIGASACMFIIIIIIDRLKFAVGAAFYKRSHCRRKGKGISTTGTSLDRLV